jgi:hypothetical protein
MTALGSKETQEAYLKWYLADSQEVDYTSPNFRSYQAASKNSVNSQLVHTSQNC